MENIFPEPGTSIKALPEEGTGKSASRRHFHRTEFARVAEWAKGAWDAGVGTLSTTARSLSELIAFLSDPNAKGVDLYLHHQQRLDTGTPSGRMLFETPPCFSDSKGNSCIYAPEPRATLVQPAAILRCPSSNTEALALSRDIASATLLSNRPGMAGTATEDFAEGVRCLRFPG